MCGIIVVFFSFSFFFVVTESSPMSLDLPRIAFVDPSHAPALTGPSNYDAAIVFYSDKSALAKIAPFTQSYFDLDAQFGESLQLLVHDNTRVLVAPLGSLHSDVDDVRRFKGIFPFK